jgi:hypothetical protein
MRIPCHVSHFLLLIVSLLAPLGIAGVLLPLPAGAAGVEPPKYAILHYHRADGNYGDHTTGDFSDFWGLHLWGEGLAAGQATEWTAPVPFLGATEYGRFAWIELAADPGPVNFIIHRGDLRDGTDADRGFDPSATPELWLKQESGLSFASAAAAKGTAALHYRRPGGDYGDQGSADFNDFWGIHLFGPGLDPAEVTEWPSPKRLTGADAFGRFAEVQLAPAGGAVEFILHRGDATDPPGTPGRGFDPAATGSIFLVEGDATVYGSRGEALDLAILHYRRADGDYGDPASADFNDFWGLHVWTGAASPTGWDAPLKPVGFDSFGAIFEVPLAAGATALEYILHRGDLMDVPTEQVLDFAIFGHEAWRLAGATGPNPYVYPLAPAGPGGGNGGGDGGGGVVVPLPAAGWFLLAGVAGLAVAARRRLSSAASG